MKPNLPPGRMTKQTHILLCKENSWYFIPTELQNQVPFIVTDKSWYKCEDKHQANVLSEILEKQGLVKS